MEPNIFSDGMIGMFEGLPDEVVAAERTGWPADRAAALTVMCQKTGPLVRATIEVVAREFSEGVESRKAAADYDSIHSRFLRIHAAVFRTIGVLNAMRPIPDYLKGTRSLLIDFGESLEELRSLVAAVLEKVKASPPPIDWNRVAEAQAAYARGETRPYRPLSAASPDEGGRP